VIRITPGSERPECNCATCEANLVCEWVRGIAKSDRAKYRCRNYANAKLGYHWDGNRWRTID